MKIPKEHIKELYKDSITNILKRKDIPFTSKKRAIKICCREYTKKFNPKPKKGFEIHHTRYNISDNNFLILSKEKHKQAHSKNETFING